MKEKENYSIPRDPIVKFFRGNNFAFLGTLNKDGSPQVTPTWIDIAKDEGQELILINTARDRLKQKNVSRDPRVSISVVDEENPYSMITIKGRVVDQTTKGADEQLDKLTKRYLNTERHSAHSSDVKRIILKIKPEKIFYKNW
ncbi:MAG TPA: PPOX class F420-dependent oxidoreductase [Bacteroidia bacterium]|nr:PPOX class F420-dependent oxidoreductase [Bacteroidia bacterium]